MFNKDYYPTPKDLIDKMLSKIEWRNYKYILEPSCGKGDIIDRVNKLAYGRVPRFYGIELDYNLREISKNKCEIIGYDFLEFNPSDIYIKCIIANFPFSDGDKHFLKAWEVLNEGEMVCLVNAETVRNPYSKSRQLMKDILDKNNADIEYIKDAFVDAERKTSVEVAMITIKKEKDESENIFKGFQQDFLNEYKYMDGEVLDNQMVVGNDKIGHLITLSKILKNIEVEKQKAIEKASFYNRILENNLKEIGLGDSYFKHEDSFDIKERIFAINQRFWTLFFRATNFKSQLTQKTYEDFIQEYQNSKIDFTRKNINKVMEIIKFNSGKIQEENILTIFDYLTKHRKDNREHIEGRKTNSGWQLKKRWIVPYGAKQNWDGIVDSFEWDFSYKLDDIDKVFCYLGQKDFNKIKKTQDWFKNNGECEFFKLKTYKKGTVHFLVKDEYLDVLKRFNYIACASKKWIGL